MSKEADYVILKEVAENYKSDTYPIGFDINTLYDMFQIESSGRSGVEKGDYVGGFQFGTITGKRYGLIGTDAKGNTYDNRKDLAESAKAAITMYEDNKISSYSKGVQSAITGHNLSDDLAVYMAHQQGRYGMQDIVTGANSGNFNPPEGWEGSKDDWANTLKTNMLSNIGTNKKKEWENLPDDKKTTKKLAKMYLKYWERQFKVKKVEAKKERDKHSSVEASLMQEWTASDDPFGFA